MAEHARIIVFQEGGMWVAQCLEYDIGAQASTLDQLRARFAVTFAAEIGESVRRGGEPLTGIGPAPQHFQDMWDRRYSELVDVRPWQLPTNGKGVEIELRMCA